MDDYEIEPEGLTPSQRKTWLNKRNQKRHDADPTRGVADAKSKLKTGKRGSDARCTHDVAVKGGKTCKYHGGTTDTSKEKAARVEAAEHLNSSIGDLKVQLRAEIAKNPVSLTDKVIENINALYVEIKTLADLVDQLQGNAAPVVEVQRDEDTGKVIGFRSLPLSEQGILAPGAQGGWVLSPLIAHWKDTITRHGKLVESAERL